MKLNFFPKQGKRCVDIQTESSKVKVTSRPKKSTKLRIRVHTAFATI